MRAGDRITAAQLRSLLAELRKLWVTLYTHAVTEAVIERAAQSSADHALRAYDALHLAGALSFAEGEQLLFACWDKELRDAALESGLALVPEQL
jgi:predicted nucleic acid-binding protein